MARYTVVLEPDPGGRAFTALVPLLPGCVSEGPTVEAALAIYLESSAAHGEEIPVEGQPLVVAAVEVAVPAPAAAR